MDGEAGWWTTSGNIGLPPLARAMGVGRQHNTSGSDLSDDVVGSGSSFARTDDAEGCGDISLLCSSI